MLFVRYAATALFIVAVPVFLVLTNVRVAATEPRVFGYSFPKYDVVEVTGVDRAQLDRAAVEMVRYFRNSEPLLTTRVTIDGQEQALFNPREVLHMRDVKERFQASFRVHEAAFVYIVGYVAAVFLWSRERPMRRLAEQSILAGVLTAGILATAALTMLVGFDAMFRQFHLLSFSNDFWMLDPATDRLVQMFPQGFWFDVSLAVGVASVAQGALIAFAGWAYLRWLDRPSKQRRTREAPATAAADG